MKTVSLNNLTETTKSGEHSSARQKLTLNKGLGISSNSGPHIALNYEAGNMKMNSSQNNNSISSLKLNEKNLLIDLGNQSKTESYYSPLARERSNTVNSTKDKLFNKCKSSKSISSNGQGSSGQLKGSINMLLNTPYRNVKLSSRKYNGIKTTNAALITEGDNFEEK